MSLRFASVLCATNWRPDRTSTGCPSPPLMRWSAKPSRPREESGGLTLPAIRLAPGADDAAFIETAESDRRRQPYPARSLPVLLSAALSVVAATLGWTVYYDLLDRHPLSVSPPSSARPVVASPPKEPFPPDGTMVADFQPSEASGAGLTLQMPAADLSLLFVVVFEDWQTGAYVGHAFLRANTVATFRLPPGHYRIVTATGHAWLGLSHLFGPETRVAETIGPVAVSLSGRAPQRLTWGADRRHPIAEVPTGLFKMLVPERR